jgi:hypothetical protein
MHDVSYSLTAFNVQAACAISCRLLCMVLGCVLKVLISTWVSLVTESIKRMLWSRKSAPLSGAYVSGQGPINCVWLIAIDVLQLSAVCQKAEHFPWSRSLGISPAGQLMLHLTSAAPRAARHGNGR